MGRKVRSFTWADLKQGGMWAWLILGFHLLYRLVYSVAAAILSQAHLWP